MPINWRDPRLYSTPLGAIAGLAIAHSLRAEGADRRILPYLTGAGAGGGLGYLFGAYLPEKGITRAAIKETAEELAKKEKSLPSTEPVTPYSLTPMAGGAAYREYLDQPYKHAVNPFMWLRRGGAALTALPYVLGYSALTVPKTLLESAVIEKALRTLPLRKEIARQKGIPLREVRLPTERYAVPGSYVAMPY